MNPTHIVYGTGRCSPLNKSANHRKIPTDPRFPNFPHRIFFSRPAIRARCGCFGQHRHSDTAAFYLLVKWQTHLDFQRVRERCYVLVREVVSLVIFPPVWFSVLVYESVSATTRTAGLLDAVLTRAKTHIRFSLWGLRVCARGSE